MGCTSSKGGDVIDAKSGLLDKINQLKDEKEKAELLVQVKTQEAMEKAIPAEKRAQYEETKAKCEEKDPRKKLAYMREAALPLIPEALRS